MYLRLVFTKVRRQSSTRWIDGFRSVQLIVPTELYTNRKTQDTCYYRIPRIFPFRLIFPFRFNQRWRKLWVKHPLQETSHSPADKKPCRDGKYIINTKGEKKYCIQKTRSEYKVFTINALSYDNTNTSSAVIVCLLADPKVHGFDPNCGGCFSTWRRNCDPCTVRCLGT